MKKILFVKPPDRFLENEFTYQQLGPHFLQAYLEQHGINSDLLILSETSESRTQRLRKNGSSLRLDQLEMLHLTDKGANAYKSFDKAIFSDYQYVGMSVMTPQAGDAYLLNELLNNEFPSVTTMIGGSHARYYLEPVLSLPEHMAFDFVVPQDGWKPVLDIVTGRIRKKGKPVVVEDNQAALKDIAVPTRPDELIRKYSFEIAGVPAFHTITALGCAFSCNFCESGRDRLRLFPYEFIDNDLKNISRVHDRLGHTKKGVMFFDDVGLVDPKQVARLSALVKKHGFTTWRAFTHAYLVKKYGKALLKPFVESGGRRIGIGLESGSQRSLDLINKRNGKFQPVRNNYEAVRIANEMGIAVDAFTMIFPWENEQDLVETTEMLEFVVDNKIPGRDEKGRKIRNHVDSTIMAPYRGTEFYDMITAGKMPQVKLKEAFDPAHYFYKGNKGGSGWPYLETRLPPEKYIEVQKYRNSLRPGYR